MRLNADFCRQFAVDLGVEVTVEYLLNLIKSTNPH